MSFQSFRLGEIALQQPLPPHLAQLQQGQQQRGTSSVIQPVTFVPIPKRAPYGAGDTDDGYTLVFPNLDAFHEWRRKEEEAQVVEFVKGDTHGSKAVPPRFKEHTKLVCARHSRSGRKKYVKKHPERVRKVPSRKIEGVGCPASISFKTFFDTEEVRVCYISQHSHETGLANLPFTRRGRKAAAENKSQTTVRTTNEDGPPSPSQPSSAASFPTAGAALPVPPQALPYPQVPQPPPSLYHHPYPYPLPPLPDTALGQDRWQNMETLFNSIRHHARTFAYPVASVAALESVLIRLFLESPQAPAVIPQPPPPPPPIQPPPAHRNDPAPDEEEEEDSESE